MKSDKNDEIPIFESIPKFLTFFNDVEEEFLSYDDDVYLKFYNQLEDQNNQCDVLLGEVTKYYYNKKIMFEFFLDRFNTECPE